MVSDTYRFISLCKFCADILTMSFEALVKVLTKPDVKMRSGTFKNIKVVGHGYCKRSALRRAELAQDIFLEIKVSATAFVFDTMRKQLQLLRILR